MPCGSERMTPATSDSASSSRARSSVRSIWKRANGTAPSSSPRIRSAPPSSPTMSAGSEPAGIPTTFSSSRSGSTEAARTAACWPAASASRQSRTTEASPPISRACSAVRAVPITPTALPNPAWCSAITSV